MAKYSKSRRVQDLTRKQLEEEVEMLRLQNEVLQKYLAKNEHTDQWVNKMREAVSARCEKHRHEKLRLQKVKHLMRISTIIIIILSGILAVYSMALGFIDYGKSSGVLKENLPWLIKWFSDDKVGSFLVGMLGFGVAIPSQITFPAPWRSYIAATAFAAKQMINLLLPGWCIGFLGLFAFAAIITLEFDRKSQINKQEMADVMNREDQE